MGELKEKKSQDSSSVKRTVGVADYFTILGVGDDLLWKHTQKQREQQQLLEQQQQQQQQDHQGEPSDASESQDSSQQQQQQQQQQLDPNQEDQAALMERYYREIIDVTIVAHHAPRHVSNYPHHPHDPANPPSSVAPTSSSILLASSPSYEVSSDVNSSTTHGMHHHQHQHHPGILSSPSSHSEATTVATTIVSASDTAGTTTYPPKQSTQTSSSSSSHPPSEMDGFTVFSKTHPPQKNYGTTTTTNNNQQVWNNPSMSSHTPPGAAASPHHVLGNPLSTTTSFSQPPGMMETTPRMSSHHTTTTTSFPWDPPAGRPRYGQQHQQSNNADKYTFDANLDASAGGLRDQVCAAVLQWEEASSSSTSSEHPNSLHPPPSSGASVGGSSTGGGGGASLKGLRRKVESSWKRWNQHPTSHNINSKAHHHQRHSSTKFYLGYKRRTPDQDHAPAIADIQLLYVRLPRQATTTPPSEQSTPLLLLDHHSPASPPGSSAGLAGRVAAAAGHVLFRSHSEVESTVSSSHHTNNDNSAERRHQIEDFQKVELESVLVLPEGFDEWSIPEAFQVVYLPKPQPPKQPPAPPVLANNKQPTKSNRSKGDALRQKTVLVASPSHGQRRRQRPHSPTHTDNTYSDGDSHRPPSEVLSVGSSTAEEAVEAYVAASFSAPNSPNPREDEQDSNPDDSSSKHPNPTPFNEAETASSFVPQLFTDVPWEEDHHEAGQHHHHPYYHPEERWWYIPVLAVRKQRTGDEERFHEDPGIVDVAVSFCDRAGIAVLPQEQEDFSDDCMMDDNDEEFSLLSKSSWLVVSDGDNSALLKSEPTLGLVIGTGQNKPPKKNAPKTVKKTLGSPAVLVKRNAPIGFADIAFATRVLDRFPLKNYKGLPLPEEELPMFCYPTGCRLHRAQFSDAPLPEYYGFVVKNERGDSIYVSCVSFFEPLTRLKIEQLSNMSEKRRRTSLAHRRYCEKRDRRKMKEKGNLYCSDDAEPITASEQPGAAAFPDDDDDDESNNCILTGFDTMTTFENKTICLVSRYPFWTGFRRFLSHLHILSGSSSDLPLERYVSHLLLTVPVPKEGGPNVIVPLPALNQPMVLSLPPLKDFPMVDLPYHRLVACLDIPTIVTLVLGFVALERKVSEILLVANSVSLPRNHTEKWCSFCTLHRLL